MRAWPSFAPGVIPIVALAALACAKPSPATAPAAASEPEGPALWTVRDADTTVYLFGTVHVLRPETDWRYPALDAAFDEAAVVYFEADVTSAMAQARVLAAMPRLGLYDDDRTLATVLEPEAHASVRAALELVGVPPAMVEPMRPWLVAITIESAAMVARGFDPDSGVEAVLSDEGDAAGKQTRYFETAEQQLGFLAGLPEADQIGFLLDSAEAVVDDPGTLDELVAAWAVGDVAGLQALVEDDGGMGEAVNEAILVNRNRDWAAQLEGVMADEPGVFFVAVGAAHLVGDTGVPALLRAAGADVTGP